MKKIIFFNHFHNGDIHSSREFVKDIIFKMNPEQVEYHQNNENLELSDINIKFLTIDDDLHMDKLIYEDDLTIYINTWFNTHFGHRYYQCTLEALYYNFKIIYEKLDIKLDPIENYIPSIDYSKYNIKNVDEYFSNIKSKKLIFISNGKIESMQSDNENLDFVIKDLSDNKNNIIFVTSPTEIISDNVVQTKDIIKNEKGDLNENSYISTFCDIIIGKESGPYFFTYVKDNIETDKKQYMIPIYHIKPFINEKYFNKNKKLIHLRHTNLLLNELKKIV